jgi:dihydrolipoamide dehydrogenase
LTLSLSSEKQVEADLVLVAVGREAQLEHLKLHEAQIQVKNGKISVNANQETNQPGVYAIGDCASPIMLAHVAMAEGKLAAEHALGREVEPIAYDMVPQCIYSHPEAAMVGLTSEEARSRGFAVSEGVFPMAASGRALVEGEAIGFIKLVTDVKYGRILGVHLFAPHATEMIAQAAFALTLEATTDEVLKTIYPHPTIVEGMQEAVLSIRGQAIHLP